LIDIVILTDKDNLAQFDKSHNKQIGFIEDTLLQNALINQGLTTERITWDDTNFDWSSAKSIIFRSTWDYFYRFAEFSKWLDKVSKKTTLINSKNTIYWNIDKHYLLDLKNEGVYIAKSYFIEKGSKLTLQELHKKLGWKDTVLKPCISGTARHTYKLNSANLDEHEAIFKTLIANEAMIIQPFQHDIVKRGEVSLIFFGEQYSHAVLKVAKENEFRVQSDFGGKAIKYEPSLEEIEFGRHVIKSCTELPSYARVDIFNHNNGKIALSELELIEPELWYRLHPEAAEMHAIQLFKLLKI
jgi:hypothetical protein